MIRATVSVIKNEAGEVLLLKRSPDHGTFPEQWCFPGGKLDYIERVVNVSTLGGKGDYNNTICRWETPEECAFRETYEETGVQMKMFTAIPCYLADTKHIVYPFFSPDNHSDEDVTREFPNREHTEYGWFNQHNAPQEAGPMTKRLLKIIFEEAIF